MPQVVVNGFRLNYEEVGTGPAFVYIAGTRFDSAKQLAPSMRENGAGFRIILPDPRGMAASQHVDSIEPGDWVSDLLGLLDALSLPRVHLAAETLGSRIVTRFAVEHPDRVQTLILNGTIAYSSPAGDEARRREADLANIPEARQKSLALHHGDDWPAVNGFYLGLHSRPEFHEYYDLRNVAARVRASTLLLRGDIDDPVHPVVHSCEMHQLVPGSWLAIFPNTEFNALRGRPLEAWDLIRRFVAECGA